MCGIIGGVGQIEPERLAGALKALAHRGPDAQGLYENAGVFLGHRRLSIIDLDGRANQPMRRGSLIISYNGEIYNYREVKRDLEALGDTFSTQSDTEVILAAFNREGIACLQRFEGMFAFAIWHEEQKVLTLARDRFGEKPLVYYQDAERFFFASEVTALRTLLADNALAMDREAIAQFFQFSYIPAPRTPYKNMYQLLPGHWAQFDMRTKKFTTQSYYNLQPKPRIISRMEAIDELRTRLGEAVKLRLASSDVPVAVFLSGGIDSSIIAALAGTVHAYSIGFPEDPAFDESPYAREVAACHPSLRHTIVDVTQERLSEFADETLSKLGEPFADASIIPTAFLCSQVKEKVILGGDGADEVFAGYGVYAAMRASARVPSWLKPFLNALPKYQNPHAIPFPRLRAAALFHQHMQNSAREEYFSWRSYASPAQLQSLGIDPVKDDTLLPEFTAFDSLQAILACDVRFNLPNDMLKKVDLASMQYGLEVRLPYLDRGLVEFALGLPENMLIRDGVRKYILRETFCSELPSAVLKRRKQGFLLPIREWFVQGMFKDQLLDLARASDTLDPSAIYKLAKEHSSGNYDHSVLLWACYAFLKWQVKNK